MSNPHPHLSHNNMPHSTPLPQHASEPDERCHNWKPPPPQFTTDGGAVHKKPTCTTAPNKSPQSSLDNPTTTTTTCYSSHEAFLSHLDSNPEDHFLAPIHMYEYEDWAEASDSDDDDVEDFEWDAGITDFALFDSDRRRAEESNKPLPSKWNDLLDKQTSALQRALDRRRANPQSAEAPTSLVLGVDDLPGLTPDDSPSLRDDLDVESYHGQNEPRPSVPNYLTISVTPPEQEDRSDETSDPAESQRLVSARKQQRPGLRHSRTMSGQEHAWRRPSTDMYKVDEEPDNERREELIDSCSESGEEDEHEGTRGRGRGRR